MLYLSKASVRMSKYNRNGQKQEWYNGPIYIYIYVPKTIDVLMESLRNVIRVDNQRVLL